MNEERRMRFWERNPVSAKMLIIGLLAMLLLIPAGMIEGLIHEREARKTEVTNEIGSKWGQEQTVTGPVLRIPYLERVVNNEGHTVVNKRNIHLLPDTLEVEAKVDPSTRYRGIYESVVYGSELHLRGGFDLDLIEQSGVNLADILFNEATLLLGMSDMKGIRDRIFAEVNGQPLEMNPGNRDSLIASSVGAPIAGLKNLTELMYDFRIELNGNGQLSFIPVGKTTRVSMTSPWSSPSFSGSFLPVEREVTEKGFTAAWKVLHFNRDLPQVSTCAPINLNKHAFGVSFIIPADVYQQATRTAKYAIMFIGFTFSAFFIAEILNRKRVHPVQYLLIGFALVLFYVLLISISEHLTFGLAYLCATLATILLISCYAISVLNSRRMGGIVAAILAGLYGYMYVILNLQDYSLLMGGIGLFAVLGAIMYLTRKIDWYAGAADAG